MALEYATEAGVKARLRWEEESDDNESESLLTQLRGQVNAWMEGPSALGSAVGPSPLTEMTLDGRDARADGKMLFVRIGIIELDRIEINGVETSGWYLRPLEQDRRPGWPAQQIWYPNGWPDGFANIRLFGVEESDAVSFGFPEIPADLAEVAENTAVRAWRNVPAGQRDLSGNDEQGQPLVSRYVSAKDRDTLREYRRLLAFNSGMSSTWLG